MKHFLIRKNAFEISTLTNSDYEEVLNLDDIQANKISEFNHEVVRFILMCNALGGGKLVICDNQSLLNAMRRIVVGVGPCDLNRKNPIVYYHEMQRDLLGGIINNFNGDVEIVKLKRRWDGKVNE